MQQASSPIGNPVPTSGNHLPPAATSPRFVINLCASTTPVGLVQPSHAGLKRFTFFVSRRLEEGRERFRLHMGYFDSQEEAERILDLVRDVYPAAWAGVAPGIKLRARSAAAASPGATAPAPVAVSAPPPRTPTPVPVATSAAAAALIPTLAPAAPVAPVAAPAAAAVKLELVPDRPRAEAAAAAPASAAARSLSDLRATIESLDDTARGAESAATASGLEGEAVLRLLESARPATAARVAVVERAPSAAQAQQEPPPVTQLPQQAQAPTAPAATAAVQKPALAEPALSTPAVAAAPPRSSVPTPPVNEPALFAVQLLWSVQPIDIRSVPQLAIFSAYTLYGAEGNRDGRRWYGLRLGFFTDAVSAKQVAQYVRSEFRSVSVVPVTARERTRAGAATPKPLPAPAAAKPAGPDLKFIEDVPTDTATSGSRPALKLPEAAPAADPRGVRAAAAALGMTANPTPGKRAKLRVAQGTKPVAKRPTHNRPLSLEETLEILGAGELKVDSGRGELVNDASRRERKTPPPSGSRFSRLINRLAERLGNS
jgi:hypothetical protein